MLRPPKSLPLSLSLVADDSGVSKSQGLDRKSAVDHLAPVGAPKPPLVFGKVYGFNPSDSMRIRLEVAGQATWHRVEGAAGADVWLSVSGGGSAWAEERWRGRKRLVEDSHGLRAIHGEQDWVE